MCNTRYFEKWEAVFGNVTPSVAMETIFLKLLFCFSLENVSSYDTFFFFFENKLRFSPASFRCFFFALYFSTDLSWNQRHFSLEKKKTFRNTVYVYFFVPNMVTLYFPVVWTCAKQLEMREEYNGMIYSTNKNNCNRHTRIDIDKNKLLFFFLLLIPVGLLRGLIVKIKMKKKRWKNIGWLEKSVTVGTPV